MKKSTARYHSLTLNASSNCRRMKIVTKQRHVGTFGLTAFAVLLLVTSLMTRPATAQSDATAVQPLGLSAFGMATGTWTNILGGRNLGVTAGGDLAFLTYRRLRPVIEVRGNYPFYDGQVDKQKSFMGGLKVEKQIGPLRPYANFLIGRGQIDFKSGLQEGNLLYLKTVTTVYSPGFGVEYDVRPQWSAKVDFQYQYWDTPAVVSGSINPKTLSAGVVYRFDFNHHYKIRH